MQALEQLPVEVSCASSWARPAHEPRAFLPRGRTTQPGAGAGPPVSVTEPCSLVAGWELLDLVAAGRGCLVGCAVSSLGPCPCGPGVQGQAVEEVCEGEPRVPASSDPAYLP